METIKYYKLKDLPFSKRYFWSYDFNKAELPLAVIIEQIIKYGGFEDHLNLFKIFPKNDIFNIYYKEIRPHMLGEDKIFLRERPGAIPKISDIRRIRYMDLIFEVANVAA
ncbi:MAG: hypothetical protein M0012_05690 [Deltaproteobacteria bacterium]|nr:hypothetical protein [Deltaproteobacteria bacterium]